MIELEVYKQTQQKIHHAMHVNVEIFGVKLQ